MFSGFFGGGVTYILVGYQIDILISMIDILIHVRMTDILISTSGLFLHQSDLASPSVFGPARRASSAWASSAMECELVECLHYFLRNTYFTVAVVAEGDTHALLVLYSVCVIDPLYALK
jgi:hypothetical protein